MHPDVSYTLAYETEMLEFVDKRAHEAWFSAVTAGDVAGLPVFYP